MHTLTPAEVKTLRALPFNNTDGSKYHSLWRLIVADMVEHRAGTYYITKTGREALDAYEPVVYVDQWTTDDAEETNGTSPAPFGDNTWRVIDEDEGGVVAYFGTQQAAMDYANLRDELKAEDARTRELENRDES